VQNVLLVKLILIQNVQTFIL